MNFDKCTRTSNPNPNQDTAYFHHPQEVPSGPFPVHPLPTQGISADFHPQRLVLFVLELHLNGVIECDTIRNTYLVSVPGVADTELLKPSEFPQ